MVGSFVGASLSTIVARAEGVSGDGFVGVGFGALVDLFVGALLGFFAGSVVGVSLPPEVETRVGVSGDGFLGDGTIGDGGSADGAVEAFCFRLLVGLSIGALLCFLVGSFIDVSLPPEVATRVQQSRKTL